MHFFNFTVNFTFNFTFNVNFNLFLLFIFGIVLKFHEETVDPSESIADHKGEGTVIVQDKGDTGEKEKGQDKEKEEKEEEKEEKKEEKEEEKKEEGKERVDNDQYIDISKEKDVLEDKEDKVVTINLTDESESTKDEKEVIHTKVIIFNIYVVMSHGLTKNRNQVQMAISWRIVHMPRK